jgi:hypothetical protein
LSGNFIFGNIEVLIWGHVTNFCFRVTGKLKCWQSNVRSLELRNSANVQNKTISFSQMKEILYEYLEYTCSLLSFIKILNICSQKFIFRRFVIVWPFTIPAVIMLIVDYLWTVLMPPCGMWRAVILHMGTVQINFPTNFQSNFLPYSYRQQLPPKTWHLPVKSTRRHVPEDSNFHTHRCENLKFYSTQCVNLISHEHFPSSAFHRKSSIQSSSNFYLFAVLSSM